MKHLQFLDLNDNQIEDLKPLINLTGLEALSIMNNHVKTLAPVMQLPHLLALLAQGNQISSIYGLKKIPIISVENQFIEWTTPMNFKANRFRLKDQLVDIDGTVPSIVTLIPKSIDYDAKTNELELTEFLKDEIKILFHNQNQDFPFSGELMITISKT